MPTLNVLSICGSLRKGSFNAIVQRALPSLAPEGMTIKPAPSFAEFPLYNADIQNSTGFPAAVNTLATKLGSTSAAIPTSRALPFRGAFAEAGTEPPTTIRTIAPTTTPLVTLRMDTLLSTP